MNIIIQTGLIILLILSPLYKGAVPMPALIGAQVFTLALVCLWLAKINAQSKWEFKDTPLDIPILLYLGVALLSLTFTQYLHASLLELNRLLTYFALFYLAANFFGRKGTKRAREALINTVIAMGVILSFIGIIQYLGGLPRRWVPDTFLASVYVNHNHFAGYLELIIPLALALCIFSKEKAKKAFYGFVTVFMLLVFIITMSRGGWTSLFILLAFMAIMASRKKSITIFILLGVIAAGLIFFSLDKIGLQPILKRAAGLADAQLASEYTSRRQMYEGAAAMIKANPVLGTGIGTLIHTFPKYRPLGLNALIDYVHNDYLHTAAETGILALILLAIMAIIFARRALFIYRNSKSPYKHGVILGILTGTASLCLHGLVDFNFHIPANAILFSILAGLAMGMEVSPRVIASERSERSNHV